MSEMAYIYVHMVQRSCKLSKTQSFFLFGPRATGKSTLLEQWAKPQDVLLIDLLDPATESRYSIRPELLLEDWAIEKQEWIIIDEVQKIPALLDVAQKGIVKHKIKFALTGSSARKLKRGAGNLLGGRAIVTHLHPFTSSELNEKTPLLELLRWGSLPEVISLNDSKEKERKLYAYVSTYLKEELLAEQIIRKIEPFRRFLEIAAQMNGKITNYAKISRDANIEERSVARYYQILEDTLVGFQLEPFHESLRKRQSQKSKFYYFDLGVTRALQNTLPLDLVTQTEAYGNLFEHFFILECIRHNDYTEKRYKFSYLKTKDNLEIDLIIETPSRKRYLIEIKSKDKTHREDAIALKAISKDMSGKTEMIVVSNQKQSSIHDDVRFLHWTEALKNIFEL